MLACAAENKTTIRKCDGIALMMRAMTEHPNDALVQRNSCWAMWNLAAQSPEDRQAIASAGAIPVVLRAMALHPREAAVHQKATGVLDNLAVEGEFACAACRVPGSPHVASRRFLTCVCWVRLLSAQPWRDHRGGRGGSHHQVHGGAPDGHGCAAERLRLAVEPGRLARHPNARECVLWAVVRCFAS